VVANGKDNSPRYFQCKPYPECDIEMISSIDNDNEVFFKTIEVPLNFGGVQQNKVDQKTELSNLY